MRCRLCARVCSFDMNSFRSARQNAQVSTTCSPWVLMTVMICPASANAALPRRAGISMRRSLTTRASWSDRDQVDLDDPVARKRRDPDRGAGGAPVGREVARVDLVHGRVVAFEVGQEDAHTGNIRETQAAAFEHARQ